MPRKIKETLTKETLTKDDIISLFRQGNKPEDMSKTYANSVSQLKALHSHYKDGTYDNPRIPQQFVVLCLETDKQMGGNNLERALKDLANQTTNHVAWGKVYWQQGKFNEEIKLYLPKEKEQPTGIEAAIEGLRNDGLGNAAIAYLASHQRSFSKFLESYKTE